MCCNTKRKIADGLLEMMHEKPLRKITVQDIMDCKDMKRQSFYYHFQDIYGVIQWVCREDFLKPVAYDEEEIFEVWLCRVIQIIKENRFFYRKVLENVERERAIEEIYPVVRTQVENRNLCGKNPNSMVVRFAARSICHFILDSVEMRKGPQGEEILEAVRNIAQMLRPQTGAILVLPSSKKNLTA